MSLSSQTGTLVWKQERNRAPNDQHHAANPQSSDRFLNSGSEQVSPTLLFPANSPTLRTSSQARPHQDEPSRGQGHA